MPEQLDDALRQLVEQALESQKNKSYLKETMKQLGLVAIPAAGALVAGTAADKIFQSASHSVGKTVATQRLKRFLKKLPPEQFQRLVGTPDRLPLFLRRFKALYDLSPTLLKNPETAAGVVSTSMQSEDIAVTPDLASAFAEAETALQRSKRGPGLMSRVGETVATSITPVMAKKVIDQDISRVRLQELAVQHELARRLQQPRVEAELAKARASEKKLEIDKARAEADIMGQAARLNYDVGANLLRTYNDTTKAILNLLDRKSGISADARQQLRDLLGDLHDQVVNAAQGVIDQSQGGTTNVPPDIAATKQRLAELLQQIQNIKPSTSNP